MEIIKKTRKKLRRTKAITMLYVVCVCVCEKSRNLDFLSERLGEEREERRRGAFEVLEVGFIHKITLVDGE